MSCKRKSIKRPKALLGESAAILAAAGMQVAASGAAAKMQSDAAIKGAKEQADATVDAAKKQADAIIKQTQSNEKLQTQAIDLNKQTNQENKQLQQDAQTTLNLMAGQQSAIDRGRQSMKVVRNGGTLNKRYDSSLLRGSQNMPFQVTDGGQAKPIGQTKEGYDMYELEGNDHEHYHKTKNGKYKTGVGIKFANGKVIEGEGNQNTNQGEYMVVTPNNAVFISKHSIKGYNPAQAVNNGEDPLVAASKQEEIKDMYGISNEGGHNLPRRRKLRFSGGTIDAPTLDKLTAANNIRNMAAAASTRDKAKIGATLDDAKNANIGNAYLWGSGITALGNMLGAGISTWGTNKASSKINSAYSNASQILADAYGKLTGIDENAISRDDYQAPVVLSNTSSARVNINPEITRINRDRDSLKRSINNTVGSTAAKLSRLSSLDSRSQQMKNEVYAKAANQEAEIGRNNLQQINQAALTNAQLQAQGNKDYTASRLNLLQYNNDIANQRLTGAAQTLADAQLSIGQNNALTWQKNSQNWANAISDTFNTTASNLEQLGKYNTERESNLSKLNTDTLADVAIQTDNKQLARKAYNMYSDKNVAKAQQLKAIFNFE